jgi:hypothetical protein
MVVAAHNDGTDTGFGHGGTGSEAGGKSGEKRKQRGRRTGGGGELEERKKRRKRNSGSCEEREREKVTGFAGGFGDRYLSALGISTVHG